MGSGASSLHEEEYSMFLELQPSTQQYWLRKIPPDELLQLQERTYDLPPAVRIPLLQMVRDVTSRGGSRPVTRDSLLSVPSQESPEQVLVTESKQKANKAAEDERMELLNGMIDAQRGEQAGKNVVALKLVDVGLNFDLSEIQLVLSPFIKQLNLCRNGTLSGDLRLLAGCVDLTDLCLEGTKVRGDLSSLSSLRRLHKIQLSDLEISGSIEVLKDCVALKKVWLRGCQYVGGDIGVAFARTPLLLDVMLRRTQVNGNVAVFEKCKRLQNFTCSRSQVHGKVDVFRGCHALQVLALDFCPGIIGEREGLERALPLCAISF